MNTALQALVADENSLPAAARIRLHLPEIETALHLGHSRKAIYEAMKADGLRCSFATFLNALQRARKRKPETDKQAVGHAAPIRGPATGHTAALAAAPAAKKSKGFDWEPPAPESLV